MNVDISCLTQHGCTVICFQIVKPKRIKTLLKPVQSFFIEKHWKITIREMAVVNFSDNKMYFNYNVDTSSLQSQKKKLKILYRKKSRCNVCQNLF